MIWDVISKTSQITDSKLQKCASSVIKASVGLTAPVEKMVKIEKSLKEAEVQDVDLISKFGGLVESVNYSVALLCRPNYQNCMLRRDLIKPELKKIYSVLCTHFAPYTNFLFGDDISKTGKDIEDGNGK